MASMVPFFFFQAEDGIRDYKVTGVQTCALPIYASPNDGARRGKANRKARRKRRVGLSAVQEARVPEGLRRQIGRASCRERVEISVVAGSLKKKKAASSSGKALKQ